MITVADVFNYILSWIASQDWITTLGQVAFIIGLVIMFMLSGVTSWDTFGMAYRNRWLLAYNIVIVSCGGLLLYGAMPFVFGLKDIGTYVGWWIFCFIDFIWLIARSIYTYFVEDDGVGCGSNNYGSPI